VAAYTAISVLDAASVGLVMGMWTTVNLLLLNLAVTDVIFVLVCVPFMAYHYAADNWLIGDAVCKLSQFFLYVTVYVTVYTLVAIAVIRYRRYGLETLLRHVRRE